MRTFLVLLLLSLQVAWAQAGMEKLPDAESTLQGHGVKLQDCSFNAPPGSAGEWRVVPGQVEAYAWIPAGEGTPNERVLVMISRLLKGRLTEAAARSFYDGWSHALARQGVTPSHPQFATAGFPVPDNSYKITVPCSGNGKSFTRICYIGAGESVSAMVIGNENGAPDLESIAQSFHTAPPPPKTTSGPVLLFIALLILVGMNNTIAPRVNLAQFALIVNVVLLVVSLGVVMTSSSSSSADTAGYRVGTAFGTYLIPLIVFGWLSSRWKKRQTI